MDSSQSPTYGNQEGSAHEWRGVVEPVVERYRERDMRRYFRGDAAFASPDIFEFLEAEGFL